MSDEQTTDTQDAELIKEHHEKAQSFLDKWDETGAVFRKAFAANPNDLAVYFASREWDSFVGCINTRIRTVRLENDMEELRMELASLRREHGYPPRHGEVSA